MLIERPIAIEQRMSGMMASLSVISEAERKSPIHRRLKDGLIRDMHAECRTCPLKTVKTDEQYAPDRDELRICAIARCNATYCDHADMKNDFGRLPAVTYMDRPDATETYIAPKPKDLPVSADAGDW